MKHTLMKKLSAVVVTTAVLFTTVFSASIFVHAAGTSFTPRLSAPDSSNKYYYNGNYNIFYAAGYGMPNCTAYAFGRAYEILGTEPNLSWNGASRWYDDNRNSGAYPYGQTAKVGAIACWTYGTGGHVAVVESIDSNGNITLSNSAWQSTNFYLTYAHTSDSNPGGNSWWTFQGYIYIIDSPVVNNDQPTTTKPVSTVSSYKTGTYQVDAQPYLNMRSGSGLDYYTTGTVADQAKIIVTKTAYVDGFNWGYTTYNNASGWVALDFCDYVSSSTTPAPTVAPTTVAPTTVPRATAAPTTVAPTTVPRSTAAPTIAPTTTVPRSTAAPTIAPTVPRSTAPETVPTTTVPKSTAATQPTTSPFLITDGSTHQETGTTGVGKGRGDVDEDGRISIQDATIVQQYLANMIQLSKNQRRWCDVNCDGRINIDDATYLQRLLLN